MKPISSFKLAGIAVLVLLTSTSLWATSGGTNSVLVGEWTFTDGGGYIAVNSVANAPSANLEGNAFLTPDSFMGGAAVVPGAGSRVTVPYYAAAEPAQGTIEVWVNIQTAQNSDVVTKTTNLLVQTNQAGGFSLLGIRIRANGQVSAFVCNNDPSIAYPWTTVLSPAGLVTTGTWHQLALSWDGSMVTVYVDGSPRAAQSYNPVPGTGLSYSGSTPIWLGQPTFWGDAANHQFSGEVSDLRVYSGARAPGLIMSDYMARVH